MNFRNVLLALAGLLWLPGFGPGLTVTVTARDFSRQVDRTAVLTERGLRHIKERHWPTSTALGAGKFADDHVGGRVGSEFEGGVLL